MSDKPKQGRVSLDSLLKHKYDFVCLRCPFDDDCHEEDPKCPRKQAIAAAKAKAAEPPPPPEPPMPRGPRIAPSLRLALTEAGYSNRRQLGFKKYDRRRKAPTPIRAVWRAYKEAAA